MPVFPFFFFERNNHKLIHNPLNRPHLCHLCARTFRIKYALQCHILKNHADSLNEKELPQLKCDCCNRLFPNGRALNVHLTRMKSRVFESSVKKPTTKTSKPKKKKVCVHRKMGRNSKFIIYCMKSAEFRREFCERFFFREMTAHSSNFVLAFF
jgi:hypothetical protein